MEKAIEQKVAETILQKATEPIKVGNKTITAAPPSIATLILVSEAVSRLPHLKLDDKDIVREVLSVAKDCWSLGEIAAILILGATNVDKEIVNIRWDRKKVLWGLFSRKRKKAIVIDRKTELAQELLEELSPAQMHHLITRLLSGLELGDFFALTTFLSEINLLRQTKVETETTAFGQ
jgi:hypothetical protein